MIRHVVVAKQIRIRDLGILMAITILPILLVAATLFWWEYEIERQGQYNSLILSASRQYQVPRELIKAVIWRESRFTEDAYGKAKERGLMQVTPAAGKDWAKAEKIPNFQPESLYIPNTNVRAGTWYLARALKRWNKADDPVVFALAEYNAGPVHARRWAAPLKQSLKSEAFMDNIDYPTTHKYILDIKERMAFYKASPSPSPWEFVQDRIKIYWNKWKSRSSNSNR